MDIYRTSKQFDADDIDIEFARQALALGGKDSCILKYEDSRFEITNRYAGKFKDSTSSYPQLLNWSDEHADQYDKVLSSISIKIGTFDTEVIIWQDGRIQGYYQESAKAQFAADPIKWCNLLLKYGYLIMA